MIVISTPLAAVGVFSVVYTGLLFARLSRRLTSVTRRADYSGWYFVGSALVAVAVASQAMHGIAVLAPLQAPPALLSDWFPLVGIHIPLSAGVTIDLALAWHYWKWVLWERAS